MLTATVCKKCGTITDGIRGGIIAIGANITPMGAAVIVGYCGNCSLLGHGITAGPADFTVTGKT